MPCRHAHKPTLADLLKAWICGWPNSEPGKAGTSDAQSETQTGIELIYEELRLALEVQRTIRASQETKAGILIGFTGTILALLIGAQNQLNTMYCISRCLVILGSILLIASLPFLIMVFWVRPIRVDPSPMGLAKMMDWPLEKLRRDVIDSRKDAWKKNAEQMQRNARYLKIIVIIQGIAVTFFAIALLIHNITSSGMVLP
jgi:hypothetical protein